MRSTVGFFLLAVLISACAAVVKTGKVDGNIFTDSQHGLSFQKSDNWRYFIPTEQQNGGQVVRFSLYQSQTRYTRGGGWKIAPVYGEGRDPVTGHFIHRFRRTSGPSTSTTMSAEAHFAVDTTSLSLTQVKDLLLEEYEGFEFVGGLTLGDLGPGYHLTDAKDGYGDIYFTVQEGKLYLVNFSAIKYNYQRSRRELERMLTSLSYSSVLE